jgi:hypothetical protein
LDWLFNDSLPVAEDINIDMDEAQVENCNRGSEEVVVMNVMMLFPLLEETERMCKNVAVSRVSL